MGEKPTDRQKGKLIRPSFFFEESLLMRRCVPTKTLVPRTGRAVLVFNLLSFLKKKY
jgi:hypothetical protein